MTDVVLTVLHTPVLSGVVVEVGRSGQAGRDSRTRPIRPGLRGRWMARLVGQGLGIAMLPSAYVSQLTGVTTIEVADAPARAEYVIWSRDGRTPAATAFLAILDIPAIRGTERNQHDLI